jgi:poly-gamma-glutamate capsule biosynthesis protein CapA/YwtB (metallophosphatase superfamily)
MTFNGSNDREFPLISGTRYEMQYFLAYFGLFAISIMTHTTSLFAKDFVPRHDQECTSLELMASDKKSDENDILLRFVGDIVLPRQWEKHSSLYSDDIFAGVREYLQAADLSFGNLEGVLTTLKVPRRQHEDGRIYNFSFDPNFASLLKHSGFKALNIANNHSHDYGEEGYHDTIRHLSAAEIKAVGLKDNVVVETIKGLRIAFIGFSFYPRHNMIQNFYETQRLINEAKSKADFIVVTFHGGTEGSSLAWRENKTEYYRDENRGNTRDFARVAIDAGADAVIGHGPHVIRPIECYKGRPIAHSLGNFLTLGGLSSQGENGISIIFGIRLKNDGRINALEILPIHQTIHKIPWYDEAHRASDVMQRLSRSASHQASFLNHHTIGHNYLTNPVYWDVLLTQRPLNTKEMIELTTRYPLKAIPNITVKGTKKQLLNARIHLAFLAQNNKLTKIIVEYPDNILSDEYTTKMITVDKYKSLLIANNNYKNLKTLFDAEKMIATTSQFNRERSIYLGNAYSSVDMMQ